MGHHCIRRALSKVLRKKGILDKSLNNDMHWLMQKLREHEIYPMPGSLEHQALFMITGLAVASNSEFNSSHKAAAPCWRKHGLFKEETTPAGNCEVLHLKK